MDAVTNVVCCMRRGPGVKGMTQRREDERETVEEKVYTLWLEAVDTNL